MARHEDLDGITTILLAAKKTACTPQGRAAAEWSCGGKGFFAKAGRKLLIGAVMPPVAAACSIGGAKAVRGLMNTVCGADDAQAEAAIEKVMSHGQRKEIGMDGYFVDGYGNRTDFGAAEAKGPSIMWWSAIVVGLGLIVFPEPATTAAGFSLVAAAVGKQLLGSKGGGKLDTAAVLAPAATGSLAAAFNGVAQGLGATPRTPSTAPGVWAMPSQFSEYQLRTSTQGIRAMMRKPNAEEKRFACGQVAGVKRYALQLGRAMAEHDVVDERYNDTAQRFFAAVSDLETFALRHCR